MTFCPGNDRLRAFLDAELPEDERGEIETHVETCPRCQELLDGWTAAGAAGLPPLPPVLPGYPEANEESTRHQAAHPSDQVLPGAPGYEIIRELGRGGVGVVYLARQLRPPRLVALKTLQVGRGGNPRDRARFRNEAESLALLQHPNIVPVYEVGECGDRPFFTMEYMGSGDLNGRLGSKPLPPREAALLVETLARAAHHAHQRGVIHRDLKPSNILLADASPPGARPRDEAGEPALSAAVAAALKISDFGLAKCVSEGSNRTHLTRDGLPQGTPGYMAPEQAWGRLAEVSVATDVHALGAILYRLLTGRRPYEGDTEQEIIFKTQAEEEVPLPPSVSNPAARGDLEVICMKCLEKEPARRYQTAGELAEHLRLFLDGKPVPVRPLGWLERLARWGRRNPALAAVGGVAVALLLAATGVSVAWAAHADRQSVRIRQALDESRRVTAEAELDRGLVEANRGDVAFGMHWMARGLASAPEGCEDLTWAIRANLTAWGRQMVTLEDCIEPPAGEVLAFAPDGRAAWFVAPDGRTVRCWDLAAAQVVGQALRHATAAVECLAVSPDGKRVACGGRFGVHVWDAATGKLDASLASPVSVAGLAYSPDGRSLVLAVVEKDRNVRLATVSRVWDGKTLSPPGVVIGRTGLVALVPSRDGHTLFTADRLADRELRRWDAATGQPLDRILRHPVVIKVVAISPDGRRALTGGDDRVARLWDVESGQVLAVLHHRNPLTAVAFDKDGRTLLTAAARDAIRVWHVPEEAASFPGQRHPARVRVVAVSPDGSLVATGADDRQVRLWKTSSGKLVPAGDPLPHGSPIQAIAFSPDGKVVATAAAQEPKGAQLWDTSTRERRAVLAHPDNLSQVCFSPDGRLAATAGFRGDVRVWDVSSGRPALPRPLVHGLAVWAVTFSPDGRTLITGGRDRMVHRWDVATGAEIGTPLRHDDRVRVAAFHPTDQRTLLAVGDDGVARLWNATTGNLDHRLVHGCPITVAGFAGDGRFALTGGQDGKARIWDTATGREVERPLEQGGGLRALAASRDGKWAVTASEDGTARLWAIRGGRPIGPPLRHDPCALCAAIDPAGRWVVTAGFDQTARLRPAPAELIGAPESIALWVQAITGGDLGPRGDLRPLAPPVWRQRQSALRQFAGLPLGAVGAPSSAARESQAP
jgi:WD40 repeat protein